MTKTKSRRTVTAVTLDKVRVSARSGTVWAGQAYWYFFFDRLQTIPPLLSDDCHTLETVLFSPNVFSGAQNIIRAFANWSDLPDSVAGWGGGVGLGWKGRERLRRESE